MLHAIKSLKMNRAQLKSRKSKNQKDLLSDGSGETKVEFKKVDPRELERIKAGIREKARKSKQNEIILFLVIIAAISGFLYYAFS